MIRIALAEDNPSLAKSLEERISHFDNVTLKILAPNGDALLKKLVHDTNIELILMDIQMPVMDGIKAVELVKQKYPHIKVVMLTIMDDEESIFRAIKAGADGYLLKDISAQELRLGIEEIMSGGAPMSPSIAIKTLKLLRNPLPEKLDAEQEDFQLSTRETEVLEQLSKGLNYNEIGDNLNISTGTVRKHLENTYRKLQVHNKMEAVARAKKARII